MSIICKSNVLLVKSRNDQRNTFHNILEATEETHIFMLKPGKNFDFSQCPLAVSLMLERRNLLNGYFCIRHVVVSGAARKITQKPSSKGCTMMHIYTPTHNASDAHCTHAPNRTQNKNTSRGANQPLHFGAHANHRVNAQNKIER